MKDAEKQEKGLTIQCQRDETEEQAVARTMLSPALQSALTIPQFNKSFDDVSLTELVEELRRQTGQTIDGNLGRVEAMLVAQAHTLDAIFGNLARRAINAEYLPQFDTYLKLGLRAQSQCRATWETLAAIKNPVGRAYVGQANFAHNQQVNNAEPSRTREKQNSPNEQLEQTDGQRMDPGTPRETIRGDQAMETVGQQHRPKDA